jgi:hypothetical protein
MATDCSLSFARLSALSVYHCTLRLSLTHGDCSLGFVARLSAFEVYDCTLLDPSHGHCSLGFVARLSAVLTTSVLSISPFAHLCALLVARLCARSLLLRFPHARSVPTLYLVFFRDRPGAAEC